MNCCQQRGLNQIFSPRMARWEADNFRRHGLDKRDQKLAQAIAQCGVQDASVLEIGGGIGGLQIALLRAGASRATDVDISEGYVAAARELAQSLGFGERATQRVADFAHEADNVDAADVVVMNRVVCCYPDLPALVRPAAHHTRRLLALVFPRETWWMQLGERAMNFGMWLLRRDFRFFVHPHQAIIALTREAGLRPTHDQLSGPWRLMIFERMRE